MSLLVPQKEPLEWETEGKQKGYYTVSKGKSLSVLVALKFIATHFKTFELYSAYLKQ